MSCKDYTVSKRNFGILQCDTCGFRFTSPRPYDEELGSYYKSEEYISHSDTKRGWINRLYHWIRNYTLIKKLQLLLRSTSKRGVVLDYGCGTGAFLNVCLRNKWQVYGLEPDETAANLAQKQYGLNVFSSPGYAREGIRDLELDAVTMWHVLEHVADLESLFELFSIKLKPGGVLIIAVPNCESYDAIYYREYWAAYDVPRHLYHFTPKTIESLIVSKGYRLEKVMPMIFDSFYVSMLSEKYKTGKVNYIKAFIIGLRSNAKAIKTGKEFSSQIYVFRKL